MIKNRDSLNQQGYKWSRHDWFYLGILLLMGIIIMFPGLSIRSLWGSEGRWAVIAREMIQSGNYFLPTINGVVYFDKPLLSYWAIILFALRDGVTEVSLRLPSVMAGIGACLITFAIGRRLFGSLSGFISGLLLMTTVMFIFWSRTGSAELLNLCAIWLMFWLFISGGLEGRFSNLFLIYNIGAVSAFIKGPIAPSVVIFAVILYSLVRILGKVNSLKNALLEEFSWILSRNGLSCILFGIIAFILLLLMPVWVTGSWESVQLMWRENVERFFAPFDHVEPAYAYFKHVMVFTAPWTLLVIASFFYYRTLWSEKTGQFILLITIGIFLFFTLSGSRRSYYILPLIPALMIITGKVLTDFLEKNRPLYLKFFFLLTGVLVGLSGFSLLYIYLRMDSLRHVSEPIICFFMIIGAILTIVFTLRKRIRQAFIIHLIMVLILEVWVFTTGVALAERQRRDLRTFSQVIQKTLAGIGNEKIVIFRDVSSSLIFYLNRGRIKEIYNGQALKEFIRQHREGFIIVDLKNLKDFNEEIDFFNQDLKPVVIEKGCEKRGECVALYRFSHD